MPKIKHVVSITPVWKESTEMIMEFYQKMNEMNASLKKHGVHLSHYYLDDGAPNLPMKVSHLRVVTHPTNLGLAKTLVDGYTEASKHHYDLVIRLDVQEHDPWKILEIVDTMEHSDVGALFLPVYYWVAGELRPSMRRVQEQIVEFNDSLAPIDEDIVLKTYNQVFPLGYQVFRPDVLKKLVPMLEEGLQICEKITGKPATWGLDLLVILLTARMGVVTDSFFGGWSEPWKENREADKVEAQKVKARTMIDVAKALGCRIKHKPRHIDSEPFR